MKKRPYPELPENYQQYLSMDRLENISSSLATHPPSEKHPITYEFSAKDNKKRKLQCKTYTEAGMPLITVNRSTFFSTDFVQDVAREHQARQIETCNALLKQKKLLKILEVDSIRLEFKSFPKDHFLVTYVAKKKIHPNTLLETMGYNINECKWKLIPEEIKKQTREINIHLCVLQAIDAMVQKLTELDETAVEKLSPKRMRCN